MTDKTIYDMLHHVQKELNAPKTRYNSFAKYNYRSCEDILAAVKKVLPEGCIVSISDSIELIGDRYYIKATACFRYSTEYVQAAGWAREPLEKKGNDVSQITGAASSYARKYALNGLFLIDDTDDADSQDNTHHEPKKTFNKVKSDVMADGTKVTYPMELSTAIIDEMWQLIDLHKIPKESIQAILNSQRVNNLSDLSPAYALKLIERLKNKVVE